MKFMMSRVVLEPGAASILGNAYCEKKFALLKMLACTAGPLSCFKTVGFF
jgi:hypothetical protein